MKRVYLTAVLIFLTLSFSTITNADSVIIPMIDFRPMEDTNEFWIGTSYGIIKSTSTDNYFGTPIYLPNGAKIVKVTLFFNDPGTESIKLFIRRTNLYNSSFTDHFSITTSGDSAGLRNQSAHGYIKINNSGYEQVISLWMPTNIHYRVWAVKLIYNL